VLRLLGLGRHRAAVVVLGLLTLVAPMSARQGQSGPARDTTQTARHTAVLSGVILSDDEAARPVRHARVTCTAAELTSGLTVVTDDRGRFTFAGLPAGRYTIRATKTGWVPMTYGAKAPLRPGAAIPLADGQTLDLTARMARGAVITGTLIDESGQPAVNTTVRAMRYAVQNGERRLLTFGSIATTDDRGIYRIYGLPPGDFIVGANGRAAAAAVSRVLLTTDLDVHHARTAAPQVPPPPERGVAFASTYFPGTPLASQAGRLTLRAGEERTGIDFALQLVPTATVEGFVYSPEGAIPPGTQVTLLASGDTAFPDVPFDGLRTTRAAPDGSFSFPVVSPGQYTILARAPSPVSWAATQVVVDGDRVSGLSLSLQPGLVVSGIVRFDSDRLKPPDDLRSVRIALRPIQTQGMIAIAPAEVTADANGHFTVTGVTPGLYRLSTSLSGLGRPGGWLLRAAAIGRQDTLDVPYAIQPGQLTPEATIVFTDRAATLTGTLQTLAGGAAAEYTVVLFPVDQTLWTPQSRRIQAVRPSADGVFTFQNLVSGDYLLAAVDDAESGEWFDPAFLQRITPGALRIAIADNEQKIQPLRLARD
jgi:uncharacterized protein (DUF2141 family)